MSLVGFGMKQGHFSPIWQFNILLASPVLSYTGRTLRHQRVVHVFFAAGAGSREGHNPIRRKGAKTERQMVRKSLVIKREGINGMMAYCLSPILLYKKPCGTWSDTIPSVFSYLRERPESHRLLQLDYLGWILYYQKNI